MVLLEKLSIYEMGRLFDPRYQNHSRLQFVKFRIETPHRGTSRENLLVPYCNVLSPISANDGTLCRAEPLSVPLSQASFPQQMRRDLVARVPTIRDQSYSTTHERSDYLRRLHRGPKLALLFTLQPARGYAQPSQQ